MELGGATVVVTGASRGIGNATAVELARRGADVVAAGQDRTALDDLTRRIGAATVLGDVREPHHAERIVDAALSTFGRIDGAVANAGVGHAGAFADMTVERIDELLDVNFRAPMLLARAVVPHLVEQGGGGLLFVSSIAGVVPVAFEAAYVSSKTALESFADSLRIELASSGVAVSVVRPGVVRTAFHDGRDIPYARRYPRLVEPERVARLIADVIETGEPDRTVPRWLGLAATVRATSPGLFRRLAARLG